MNAFELFNERHEATGIFACGLCRIVSYSKDGAEACCACKFCGEVVESAKIGHGDYNGYHGDCWTNNRVAREAKVLADAELVEHDGYVYSEQFRGSRDGYYPSVNEFVEHLTDNETPKENWPARVHICETVPFDGLDASNLLDDLTQEMYDDAYSDLGGVKELEKAIEAFNEDNKGMVSFHPDYERAVAVPLFDSVMAEDAKVRAEIDTEQ